MERRKGELSDPPRIYVWCNSCSHQWHTMVALAEDGAGISGHVCSSHGFAGYDMGFNSEQKHERYDEHYPDGWELIWVEDFKASMAGDSRFAAAIEANRARADLEKANA